MCVCGEVLTQRQIHSNLRNVADDTESTERDILCTRTDSYNENDHIEGENWNKLIVSEHMGIFFFKFTLFP
jgi:hypothetical protein